MANTFEEDAYILAHLVRQCAMEEDRTFFLRLSAMGHAKMMTVVRAACKVNGIPLAKVEEEKTAFKERRWEDSDAPKPKRVRLPESEVQGYAMKPGDPIRRRCASCKDGPAHETVFCPKKICKYCGRNYAAQVERKVQGKLGSIHGTSNYCPWKPVSAKKRKLSGKIELYASTSSAGTFASGSEEGSAPSSPILVAEEDVLMSHPQQQQQQEKKPEIRKPLLLGELPARYCVDCGSPLGMCRHS